MWKDSFSERLRTYLQLEFGVQASTDMQTYQFIHSRYIKNGTWAKIATLCGATEKNVHDYYHNTWSKQFCDSYDEYKPEMFQQLEQLVNSSTAKSEVLHQIIYNLQQQYPEKNFHSISLRQILAHAYERLQKKQRRPSQAHENDRHESNRQNDLQVVFHKRLSQNLNSLTLLPWQPSSNNLFSDIFLLLICLQHNLCYSGTYQYVMQMQNSRNIKRK
ncbi:Conserved_hypothetical protein [Hexamita inflata]|uniref:Uncharacterized protein n=1 Tax=Hexamita inflata TaxID=28002 RepID=A0ABP1GWV8_9EUKA